MLNTLLKKALPHTAAVVLFILLSSAFFGPVWDGYDLRQGDISHWRGMSQEIANYRLMYGEEPLWTNSMFGGMPAYQISVIHSDNVLLFIDKALKLGLPGPVGAIFMCMLGFYILTLCLRVNPWLGMAGAVAFGFSTINILYLGAGHTAKVNAISYMAPALGGVILALRGRWLMGSALFALFFGLNVAANHLQMTYYLSLLLAAVVVGESVRLLMAREVKQWLLAGSGLAVALVIAVLPSMGNLLTTYEYSQYTTRGKTDLTIAPPGEGNDAKQQPAGLEADYILQYNFGSGEVLSLLIPDIKGGASGPIGNDAEALKDVPRELRKDVANASRYFGEQLFTGGAFYAGAFIMALFIIALFFVNDSLRWPFLVVALLAATLCLKDYSGFNRFFIDTFPMYNKFRDSKMILVLVQLMAPALAVVLLHQLLFSGLFAEGSKWLGLDKRKAFYGMSGALALMFIVIAAKPGITGDFLSKSEKEQFAEMEEKAPSEQLAMIDDYKAGIMGARQSIVKADAVRSLLFVLGAIAVVVAAAVAGLKPMFLFPVVIALAVIDNWSVASRYLNDEKTGKNYRSYVKKDENGIPYEVTATDKAILEKESVGISGFEEQRDKLLKAMQQSKTYEHVKSKDKLEELAAFGTLGLNSNYRVLQLRNPFSDGETPFYHKSIGGYHGAKLKRYQELIEFHLQPEISRFIDSLQATQRTEILRDLPVLNMLNTRYIAYNPDAAPIENKYALGDAWFVRIIQTAANADEEMTALGGLNVANMAIIPQAMADRAQSAPGLDSSASVTLESYAVKQLKYRTTSNVTAPVVFSEMWYPEGWICRVDGQEVEPFRANYVLRGVQVPAGEHSVEWSFEPTTWKRGQTMSMTGSALLLMLLLSAVFVEWKQRGNKPSVQ
jgi:hypothetical protein